MFISSLWTGTLETGFTFSLDNWTTYPDALAQYGPQFVRSIVYGGRGDHDLLPDRLSRSPTRSRSAAAATRACCCSWSSPRSSPASCCGHQLEDHPRRRRHPVRAAQGPRAPAGRTSASWRRRSRWSPGITYNFLPFMTLPLYVVAREDRQPAGRGGEGPVRRAVAARRDDRRRRSSAACSAGGLGGGLRATTSSSWRVVGVVGGVVDRHVLPVRVVHPGHPAAVAAGRLRRLAPDVHPGHRRLRQRRAAGQPPDADDRQRHPEPVPRAATTTRPRPPCRFILMAGILVAVVVYARLLGTEELTSARMSDAGHGRRRRRQPAAPASAPSGSLRPLRPAPSTRPSRSST